MILYKAMQWVRQICIMPPQKGLSLIMGARGVGVTSEMIMDNGVNNVNFMGKLKNIFKDL